LNPLDVPAWAPEPGHYSQQFAAVLAEGHGPASKSAKDVIGPVPARHGLSPDDARHLPALVAAGLAFLLLVGSGAASWYAIIGALPRDGQIAFGTSVAASDHHSIAPTPRATALVESGTPLPSDSRPPAGALPAPVEWSAREVWLPAAVDPVLSEPVPVGIETAAAPVAPQLKPVAQPAPDVVAAAAESSATPEDLADPVEATPDQVPRPGTGAPVTVGGGSDSKGTGNSLFVDPYPEKPAAALSNVTTASRVGTGGAAGNDNAPAGSGNTPGNGNQTDTHSKKDGKGAKGNAGDGPGPAGPDAKGDAGPPGGKGPGSSGPDAKDDKGKGHTDKDKGGGKGPGGKDHGGKGNGGKGNGKGH